MHHVKIFIMNVIKIDALLFLLTGYGRLYQKGVEFALEFLKLTEPAFSFISSS